jgi:hypothetical protein
MLAEKAALSSGLSVGDLRIDLISWVLLEIDAEKHRMLSGRAASVALWTRVADKLQSLVPPPAHVLRVKFIDAHDVCCLCAAKLPKLEDHQPAPATPVKRKRKLAIADTAPALPPPQSNVTPVKRPDTYAAQWVDIGADSRKPLPPLGGNSVAEKVASLNVRPSSPLGVRSGYGRFDNTQ